MDEIYNRIYEWSERHDKAIKIGAIIAIIICLAIEGAINNGLI